MTSVAIDAPTRSRSTVPLAIALLLPIAAINAIGFIAPVLNLFRMSFNEATGGGGLRETATATPALRMDVDAVRTDHHDHRSPARRGLGCAQGQRADRNTAGLADHAVELAGKRKIWAPKPKTGARNLKGACRSPAVRGRGRCRIHAATRGAAANPTDVPAFVAAPMGHRHHAVNGYSASGFGTAMVANAMSRRSAEASPRNAALVRSLISPIYSTPPSCRSGAMTSWK